MSFGLVYTMSSCMSKIIVTGVWSESGRAGGKRFSLQVVSRWRTNDYEDQTYPGRDSLLSTDDGRSSRGRRPSTQKLITDDNYDGWMRASLSAPTLLWSSDSFLACLSPPVQKFRVAGHPRFISYYVISSSPSSRGSGENSVRSIEKLISRTVENETFNEN